MHYFLSNTLTGATAWKFFVHEFLPQRVKFDREDLKRELTALNPTLNEKSKTANLGLLLKSYTSKAGLYKTKLVQEHSGQWFSSQPLDCSSNVYLVAYLLAEIWEAQHPDKMMVEPSVLLEQGNFATSLGLPASELASRLRDLTAIGAVDQMREAPPFQVVRRWSDKFALLRRAYQED